MYTTSPSFSISSTSRKVFVNQHNCSPGPMYDTFGLNKKSRSLSYGIGVSKRSIINHGVQKTPAPVQYNPQVIKRDMKITFSKSQRKQKIEEDLPDPGFYSPYYYEGQITGKTFQIGSKYPSIMDDVNQIPGPGAYEVTSQRNNPLEKNSRQRKSKSIFNTTALRFKSHKQQSPGPGEYNLIPISSMVSTDSNKGKFKLSQKYLTINTNQLTPGPGQYEQSSIHKALVSKLGITIKGRPKNNIFQYQFNCTQNAFLAHDVTGSTKNGKPKILSFTIGNSKRNVFEENEIPASQNYFKENFQTKTPIKITFASSKRKEQIGNQNPGPGQYEPRSQKTISYSMKKDESKRLFDKNLNPGVGRYDIKTSLVQKNIKGSEFSTSSRTNFISKNIAGVGDYEITTRVKSSITIPKSARFLQKEIHPGPGFYDIPSSIGKNFSLKQNKK